MKLLIRVTCKLCIIALKIYVCYDKYAVLVSIQIFACILASNYIYNLTYLHEKSMDNEACIV